METRILRTSELRVEETPSTSGTVRTIVGYAATYGVRSDPIGGRFYEVIERGCFGKALERKPDVRALIDHESSKILGRLGAGTLRLSDDENGLRFEIDVPDTTYGQDLVKSISRGDIDSMSFGFKTVDDKWDYNTENLPTRYLRDVELDDVSVVTYPAYPNTEVAVRHLDRRIDAESDLIDGWKKYLDSMS